MQIKPVCRDFEDVYTCPRLEPAAAVRGPQRSDTIASSNVICIDCSDNT